MNLVVDMEEVNKTIKKQNILESVNLKVQYGEVIGIVGENGSGKTTLLRMIAGMSYPDSGKISVNNSPLKKGDIADDIGILIETPSFLPNVSGINNLKYLAKIKNTITIEKIKNIMEVVGLEDACNKKVKSYSLGMRQRLGIAQAVMEKPKLVLFDEPTNALDEEGVKMLLKLISNLKSEGTSFIFVSHNREEIDLFCDKVYRIKDRKLIEDKRPIKWEIILKNREDLEALFKKIKGAEMLDSIDDKLHFSVPILLENDDEENIKNYFSEKNIEVEVVGKYSGKV